MAVLKALPEVAITPLPEFVMKQPQGKCSCEQLHSFIPDTQSKCDLRTSWASDLVAQSLLDNRWFRALRGRMLVKMNAVGAKI